MTEQPQPSRATGPHQPWSSQLLGVFLHLLHAYLVVVEIILFLGFILLLLGADPASEFVRWEYRSLERAMAPFRGAFQPVSVGGAGTQVQPVLDTAILFAMIVYGIGVAIVNSALDWFTAKVRRSTLQAELDYQRDIAGRSSTWFAASPSRNETSTYNRDAPGGDY